MYTAIYHFPEDYYKKSQLQFILKYFLQSQEITKWHMMISQHQSQVLKQLCAVSKRHRFNFFATLLMTSLRFKHSKNEKSNENYIILMYVVSYIFYF